MVIDQFFFQKKFFLPPLTTCELNTADALTTVCFFKGPLGAQVYTVENVFNLKIISDYLYVTSLRKEDSIRCFAHVSNIQKTIDGLNLVLKRRLELRGLGYKVKALAANGVELALGFSHSIGFKPVRGVEVRVIGNKSKIIEFCSNKELLMSQAIANVKAFRKKGIYKEKGIYEKNEKAICKTGKKKKFS